MHAHRVTSGRVPALIVAAVSGALILSLLGTSPAGAHTADSTPRPADTGEPVWADEFEGPAGTPPDPAKWTPEIGGEGWGNNELQYYTDSTRNATLDGDGNLAITARRENPNGERCWYGSCEYTSARLYTKHTFTRAYGRFEARIKIPRGQGIWPAFWMLGDDFDEVGWPDSGEIDIMDNVGHEPGTVHGSLHGPGYSGGDPLTGSHTLPDGRELANGFHTYAVEWTPDSISWFIDDTRYQTRTLADTGGDPWVYDHPFFLILNVAVGGDWPGSPDETTSFPQRMLIDHVRVYSLGSGGASPEPTGEIVGLDGACVDVAGADTANGTDVQLYGCNGTGGQQWAHSDRRDLVNPASDTCLDAADRSSANGTPLRIRTCTGAADQKWTVPK